MDRRIFLKWFGLGWLAAAVPGCVSTLKASSGGAVAAETTAPATLAQAGARASVPVGQVSALKQTGALLNARTPLGPVMVIQDPANTSQLHAVNPTCTHQGCQVNWRNGQQDFYCPCHGARFAADGQVLQGPARTPLTTYATHVENDTIFVSRAGQSAAGQSAAEPTGYEATGEPTNGSRHYDDDDEAETNRDRNHEDAEDDQDHSRAAVARVVS